MDSHQAKRQHGAWHGPLRIDRSPPVDHLLIRQRTAQVSAMRAHLAEYGIVAAKGRAHVRDLLEIIDKGARGLPDLARQVVLLIARMIDELTQQVRTIEIKLLAWHRVDPTCQRLETIPGIGFITATALAATVNDASIFPSGRKFVAWLGLVPKQHSSGGKVRMGGISKMGDRYVRHLLVVGATAIVRYTRRKATAVSRWATNSSSTSQPASSRSLSPTKWRELLGPLWRAEKIIALNRSRHNQPHASHKVLTLQPAWAGESEA